MTFVKFAAQGDSTHGVLLTDNEEPVRRVYKIVDDAEVFATRVVDSVSRAVLGFSLVPAYEVYGGKAAAAIEQRLPPPLQPVFHAGRRKIIATSLVADCGALRDEHQDQLGVLAAIDVLLGNHDRVPARARNDGNLENFILGADALYAIDSGCRALRPERVAHEAHVISKITRHIADLEPTPSVLTPEVTMSPRLGEREDSVGRVAAWLRQKGFAPHPERIRSGFRRVWMVPHVVRAAATASAEGLDVERELDTLLRMLDAIENVLAL